MKIHQFDRRILLTHLQAVEEKFPLPTVGLLKRDSATHIFGDDAVELLAKKCDELSLLGLAGAEADFSGRLGRPVGIILRSELHGNDEKGILTGLQPI